MGYITEQMLLDEAAGLYPRDIWSGMDSSDRGFVVFRSAGVHVFCPATIRGWRSRNCTLWGQVQPDYVVETMDAAIMALALSEGDV